MTRAITFALILALFAGQCFAVDWSGLSMLLMHEQATPATWTDLSPNGINAYQPTTSFQPTIATDGVVFDGTNDFYQTLVASGIPTGNQPFTVITRYKWDGVANSTLIGVYRHGTWPNQSISLEPVFTTTSNRPYVGRFSDGSYWYNFGFATASGSWDTLSLTNDGAGSGYVYQHGILIGSSSGTFNIVSDSNQIRIGTINPSDGFHGYWSGKISDIVVFSRSLSSAEIQDVEDWLANDRNYSAPTSPSNIAFGSLPSSSIISQLSFDNGIVDDTGKTWIATGGVSATSTNPVSGQGCIYFDGIDDALILSGSNADFNFGGKDFCIEYWTKPILANPNGPAFSRSAIATLSSWLIGWQTSPVPNTVNNWSNAIDDGFTWSGFATAGTPATSSWNHFAFVGNSAYFKSFFNGVQVSTASRVIFKDCDTPVMIGGTNSLSNWGGTWSDYGKFRGYMDEIKITNGDQVYYGDFTPSVKRPEISFSESGRIMFK